MNFVGWVPLRRGIIAHTQAGRLSNTECLVLILLIMLADKETGAGTINAPTLRTFLPGLSYDAAKRVLLTLEEKWYIYREIVPFSKHVYRYWVNRFTPSVGKYKALQCSLTKAFETRDVKNIEYVQPALEDAPEPAPEDARDAALHYNKEKDKYKDQRKDSLSEKNVSNTMSGTMSNTTSDKMSGKLSDSKLSGEFSVARQAKAARTLEQASALPSVTQGRAPAHSMPPVVATSSVQDTSSLGVSPPWAWGDPLPGYQFRCGSDPGYWSLTTGMRIRFDEARRLGSQVRG